MSSLEVASVNEIPAGTMKSFNAGGKQILITNIGGKFYGIGNICTHAGGDLSKGRLEGNIVTCPRHGSQFDVTTGKSIRGPKIVFVRLNTKDEMVYSVSVENGKLKVNIT